MKKLFRLLDYNIFFTLLIKNRIDCDQKNKKYNNMKCYYTVCSVMSILIIHKSQIYPNK